LLYALVGCLPLATFWALRVVARGHFGGSGKVPSLIVGSSTSGCLFVPMRMENSCTNLHRAQKKGVKKRDINEGMKCKGSKKKKDYQQRRRSSPA